jgi:uncharacterized membrane protein (UPF0127 family)
MGSKEKADAPVVAEAAQEPLAIVTAAGKRHDFMVEAVSAPADMAKGLMFRTEMPADQGMLFMFAGEGPRSFWMKNTFIPLDIIFIDADGKIRNIGKGVPQSLQTVKSDGDVLHVLELNAGTAEKLGFGPGDTVHHGAFGNALEQ